MALSIGYGIIGWNKSRLIMIIPCLLAPDHYCGRVVCVCVCVCVFIAKETIVLTQWGAGPGLRRESQKIALVLFLFFWGGGVDIPRINFSDPSGSWIVSLHEFS